MKLRIEAPDGSRLTPNLVEAVDRYIDGPRPMYTRLPGSYRRVRLALRARMLQVASTLRPVAADSFPNWPIEDSIDLDRAGSLMYGGRRFAVVVTHDVDSREELDLIPAIRRVSRDAGIPASFGFVPRISWPTEEAARDLVADGCEIYWHDIGHDGRLPYFGDDAIRDAFDRVADASPWSTGLMQTFRAGQLLVSRNLLSVIAERFLVDMSIPDTEQHGPYGRSAGCGTVLPFRIGSLLELPATMPQDFFLEKVHGLSPEEALEVWTRKLDYVRDVGGVAVFALHPVWIQPARRQMHDAFSRLIERVADDPDALVTTPLGLADAIEPSRFEDASRAS